MIQPIEMEGLEEWAGLSWSPTQRTEALYRDVAGWVAVSFAASVGSVGLMTVPIEEEPEPLLVLRPPERLSDRRRHQSHHPSYRRDATTEVYAHSAYRRERAVEGCRGRLKVAHKKHGPG
jgi:hypothetical protein